jgi:SAM-dependent methyltransferase
MTELRIIVRQTAEEAESLEFEYLLSMVELAARRIWNQVRVEMNPTGLPAGDGPVLLLGSGRVYVSEHSLKRMRTRLEDTCDAVYPFALATTELAGKMPLYTLGQFEALEREFFAAVPGNTPEPESHLPVSLLSGPVAADLADDLTMRRMVTDVDALTGRVNPVIEGLAHSFIDYYGERRDDIAPFVPNGISDVLEVGCAGGETARWLHDRFGVSVTGVELNPAAAERASRSLDRVIVGDIAEVELPDNTFDLVVALELVEHLPSPEPVLRKLAQAVRPGGRLLLSVPNVGHYSVVSDLMAGRWDYLPVGLLCYTHYRFFCRRTLEDWLGRCGFDRFEIEPQRTELPDDMAALADARKVDLESLSTQGFYVVVNL